MELQAFGKNILLEVEEAEHKTASGIVLTDDAKVNRPNRGTVVSVGDDVTDKIEAGLHVVYRKYAGGTGFKSGDKTYLVVHEDDILLYGN